MAGPKLELHAQAKLLEVYRATHEVREARQHNELVLAINRSDYMLDEPSSTLLQAWYHSEQKTITSTSILQATALEIPAQGCEPVERVTNQSLKQKDALTLSRGAHTAVAAKCTSAGEL